MGKKYFKNMVLCLINGLASTSKLRLDCTNKNEEVRIYRL